MIRAQELIWQGRLHLGDNPGVFGDAAYVGLSCELPFTLTHSPGPAGRAAVAAPARPGRITLALRAEALDLLDGSPGHEILVTQLVPEPSDPRRWTQRQLSRERARRWPEIRIDVDLPEDAAPIHLSVAIRIDTTAGPGLCDDLVLTRLSLDSPGCRYVASFGFHAGA